MKIQASLVAKQELAADVFVGFDNLGNGYFFNKDVFYKKNAEKLWQYKNPFLGKVTKADIQNPLKMVLFYGDFNSVVLLDNQLNETDRIDFSTNENPIVATAVGMASQNRLWIWNNLTQQLGLFDYLNNNFKVLTQSFQGNVKYYQSDFNYFQWIDEKNNWRSCDIFGKVAFLGQVPEFEKIQLLENQKVLFATKGQLYFQDLKKDGVFLIENVEKSLRGFTYKDQILSIFTDSGITNYKLNLP